MPTGSALRHAAHPTRRRRRALALAAALAVALAAGDAGAIYKWVDESGRMHFAQELHQVPPAHRAQAEANAAKGSAGASRIQTYSPPPPASRAPRAAGSAPASASSLVVHRIRVERAGTMMRVNVRINGSVTAPFYIDTGASDVAIPRKVVEQAGVDLAGARTGVYSTANGMIEVPLVTLDSVELGGARAEQVPAAVSDAMEIGLLGLSFFNRFQYSIDPASGIVTLTENGLEQQGHIRGGRSAAQWRAEFAQLADRRVAIEAEIERTPSSHTREHERLQQLLGEVERQYALLEGEADDAKVPFAWRD